MGVDIGLALTIPKPEKPAPAPKQQPAARNPKAGAGGAPKGRPVEAGAKKTGPQQPGDKQAGTKKPYRRPGKEGTPPKGQKAPNKNAGDTAKEAPAKNTDKGTGAPADSPEKTRGIRAPRWSADDLF